VSGGKRLALPETIRPLALAVFVGALFVTLPSVAGPYPIKPAMLLLLLWRVAPFAYAAAAVFLLPVFALWPPSRSVGAPLARSLGRWAIDHGIRGNQCDHARRPAP
jgi:hypothetical protein